MCRNHARDIVDTDKLVRDHCDNTKSSSDVHLHSHRHGKVVHKHPHYHPPAKKHVDAGDEKQHQHTHAYSFEVYSYADSAIHRLDARTKTVSFVALILAIVLTPASEVWRFLLFMLLIGSLYTTSGVPLSFGIKRSLIIIPFVAFAGLLLIFMPDKPHPSMYEFGFASFPIKHGGIFILFNALIKSWLSILTVVLLYSTTPFPKFIKGLEMLRFPRPITMLFAFMYRFMWVLTDEIKTMIRARDARAFGMKRNLQHMRVIGQMIGSLFIRSYERAERIYIAMQSRGYSGTVNTLDTSVLTRQDVIFILLFFGLLIAILTWRF